MESLDLITPDVLHIEQIETPSLEQRLSSWSNLLSRSRELWAARMTELYYLHLDYVMEFPKGSFNGWVKEQLGLSRITLWRYLQAGEALVAGVVVADQQDLVDACVALRGGCTVLEVNDALEASAIRPLAELTKGEGGTVKREHAVESAQLLDAVRDRFEAEGFGAIPRQSREGIVFKAFLAIGSDTFQRICAAVLDGEGSGD